MNKNKTSQPHDVAEELINEVRALAKKLQPKLATIESAALDSRLDRDLGFDSLGRVELIAQLEKSFGVHLPERVFSEAETPRDLLRAVLTAQQASSEDLQRIELVTDDVAETPEQVETLMEMLDWHCTRHADYPHIRFLQDDAEPEIITYGQLRERAQQAAASLQHQGLRAGETVALMLPTGSDYFYAFFAVLYAGGIPVPIYPPTRPAQLEDHMHRQAGILDNARCRFLITVPVARPLAGMLKGRVDSLDEVLTMADLLKPSGAYSQPRARTEDIAFIQYTSGSTGNPKGVVLSHANLLANIRVDGHTINAGSHDVFISWLPLYHDMGLIGAWLGSLYFAAQLVIMSPLSFLARPARWLQTLHKYGGTLSAAPNFAYELCMNRIDDSELEGLDLSRWRIAMNGAETVSPETIRRFAERFAPYGFQAESMFPVYGLAECSVGLAFPPMGREPRIERIERDAFSLSGRAVPTGERDELALQFVTCGMALRGHDIRIVDNNSRELPERIQGHLQFRGPSTTSGYFHNPSATATLFDGDWVESGDLAYLADGEIFITGRSKDLIIRGGRNVYPHELEQAIGEIDGIRTGRVAVFATEDQEHQTEQLVILAETRETDEAVRQHLHQQISELTSDFTQLAPDDIVLAPPGSVLKTSSGKIRRAACRDLYEQGRIGEVGRAVWLQLLRLQIEALPKLFKRRLLRLRDVGYALYAQLVFVLLAFDVAVLVLVIPGKRLRWSVMKFFARLLGWLTATPLTVRGKEHLPPGRNAIYVANHASYIDAFVMAATLPRQVRFVAKAELNRGRVLGTLLGRIGTLFVDRFDNASGLGALKTIEQAAQAGDSLLFFPEGTFTHAPGLREFHLGAFIAAVNTGLPVIPVAIDGSRTVLTGDSRFAHRGAVKVTIGEPVDPAALRDDGDSDWDLAVKLKERVRTAILSHCGEGDMGHEQVFPPRKN